MKFREAGKIMKIRIERKSIRKKFLLSLSVGNAHCESNRHTRRFLCSRLRWFCLHKHCIFFPVTSVTYWKLIGMRWKLGCRLLEGKARRTFHRFWKSARSDQIWNKSLLGNQKIVRFYFLFKTTQRRFHFFISVRSQALSELWSFENSNFLKSLLKQWFLPPSDDHNSV